MIHERLQETLGYTFGDRAILIQSMTHKSYAHENNQNKPFALRDNERLEFLGDAILDVVISDILLEAYPDANEGQLTKLRAAVVNEKTLAQVAKSIHLDECVRLGKGESLSGGHQKPSILSCTFEALIAAIYLDGGFNAVFPVVRRMFAPLFYNQDGKNINILFYDHKTRLQEITQGKHRTIPNYQLIQTLGPDHAKIFEIQVTMNGTLIGEARGSSIKEAEQNAAQNAIDRLSQEWDAQS